LLTYPLPSHEIQGFCREFQYEQLSKDTDLESDLDCLKDAVLDWRNRWSPCALYFRKGINFLKICDFRNDKEGRVITLRGWQGCVFLAIDTARTLEQIQDDVSTMESGTLTINEILNFLLRLEKLDLVYREDKLWISLVPRADKNYMARLAIEKRGKSLVNYAQ
jgi:hypothetical protein